MLSVSGAPDTTKRPQYIKKSNPSSQSNTYVTALQKVIRSPEIIVKDCIDTTQFQLNRVLDDNDFEGQSFHSDMDSDQNTSKAYETIDESDLASSINESESRSPGQFGLKHTGRFISLSHDLSHFDDYPSVSSFDHNSQQDLLPPKEFREPVVSNTHLTKSISFDIYDLVAQKLSISNQRQHPESQMCNANLYRSMPMIMGLCYEFNQTKIIDDIKSTKLPNDNEKSQPKVSVGMKSWKSDILFNLNNCVDDNNDDSVVINSDLSSIEVDPPHFESHYDSRRNSLPHRPIGGYRDIISSSSTLDTENDHDSVDISSLSSFDFDYMSYTRINKSNSAKDHTSHLTII